MTALAPADRVWRNRDTLTAEIDGEMVALDVAGGGCFGFDAVATRIWTLIEQPVVIAELCDTLLGLFDIDEETCRRDVLALLDELAREGLIRVEPVPVREA